MDRLKSLLLICLLFLLLTINLNVAVAEVSDKAYFATQLIEITNDPDKKAVVVQLDRLLANQKLTRLQQTSALLAKTKALFFLSHYDQAIKVAIDTQNISLKNNLKEQQAKASKLLGIIYYYQGELERALTAYEESLSFYQEFSNDNAIFAIKRANLLNNIALVYTSLNDASEALRYYQLAEPLYQEHGDELDKIDVRFNIAVLYINLNRFDVAIIMLKDIINQRQRLKDNRGVAEATANLGIAYKQSGQYKLAKEYVLSALTYFKKHNLKHDTASQLHNISEIYNQLFMIEPAIVYAKQAIALSKELGHQKAYAGALQSLAKAYLYQGKLAAAKRNLKLSTQVARKINYPIIPLDNLMISSLISAGQGNYASAFSEQKAYYKAQVEADNILLNKQLAKFESQRLAQEVLQLKQKRKLQQLSSVKSQQQRSFFLFALAAVLLFSFFIYRRHLEKHLTIELEKRVKQRTNALEVLTQELQQATKIKSQFLANMSHEIRTPLTAIVGHAQLLSDGKANEQCINKEVSIIQGNSQHLLHLIDDILDLSKIEANKLELELRHQDLQTIINDLNDIFSEQAQQKGLRFTVEHELSFPFIINVDGLRLKQVLINLCANAIKFTAQGSVTLNIAWYEQQLFFTISDTGIGMSEQQLTQIFELFTQADNSISRRFGGSGLGLSLSTQLAKLMAGNISVSSQLKQGSQFCLTLPCQHEDNKLAVTLLEPVIDNKNHYFSGQILLADDHDDNRHLIVRLLENIGLTVFAAKNGIEAVDLCIKHQPKLILLDIQMPDMDGIEAFKKLRSLGYEQPIYALTANAMSHEISSYLTLGFNGHLKKPIEMKSFISIIAQHFPQDQAKPALLGVNSGKYLDEKWLNIKDTLAQVDLSDLKIEFKQHLKQDKQALMGFKLEQDLIELGQLTHRLSGAAQMFGFIEISQASQELVKVLKSDQTKPSMELEQLSRENAQYVNRVNDLTDCLIDEINLVIS